MSEAEKLAEFTDAVAEGQDEILRLLRLIDTRLDIIQRGLGMVADPEAPEVPAGPTVS
jgi:hypothetical protein